MKLGLIISLLLLIGAAPLSAGGFVDEPPSIDDTVANTGADDSSSWLLLLYMAGDNNLGRDGYEWGNAVKMDLEEMEDTMPDTGLDILALADMEGPNNTYLYDLVPAPARGISSPTIPLSDVNPAWTDEVDMSDWRTLRDFLVFSLTNRSAERVMFVLWNHGAGWYSSDPSAAGSRADEPSRGFALDSNSGGAMFLDEFRDAFIAAESELGNLNMDIIGFDTCSMGMMEVFYQISPWFDLAIGSEDEQPWYGYNYTFVSVMGGAAPYTALQLASHIVSEFELLYLYPGEYTYATISVIDLKVLRNELSPRLELLSGHLIERMYQNEIVLNHKFRKARGISEALSFENVDLGSLMGYLAKGDMHGVIRESSASALEAYNRTVLNEWHQPDGRNPEATGISIYLPPSGSYRSDYDGSTGFLNFTADTLWDELVHEFHDPVERVHVDLTVQALDGDGLKDDLLVKATDPRYGSPLANARVHMNGSYLTDTDTLGELLLEDLFPGFYLFEVYNGSHVGEASVKIMNRPPVPVVDPASPLVFEGENIVLDARGSYDPDGDSLIFRWDLDSSDGLNGTDSTSAWVNLSFAEKGEYTVRLRVNDTEFEEILDIVITVINAPPKADIEVPLVVDEDQEFVASAAGSWDSWPDLSLLVYNFSLDGIPLGNWTNVSHVTLSIPDSGWHSISVQVKDPEGMTASAMENVNVVNVAPKAVISGPTEVSEDESFTVTGRQSTDTPSDVGSLEFKWFLDGFEVPFSENGSVTLSFPKSIRHTLDLLVIDDDGYSDIDSMDISVVNEAPIAIITPPQGLTTWEDSPIILSANLSVDTPSDLAVMEYSWDIDLDGEFDLSGTEIEVSWDESGLYSVLLRVTDDDGSFDEDTVVVEVRNLKPEPVISGPVAGEEDQIMEFTVEQDIDTPSDIPSLAYSWSIDGIETGLDSDIFSIMWSTKGDRNISIKVTDDDGEVGTAHLVVTIRNPKPQVVLENVPAEIEEGSSFVAVGYRTTDNPSDISTLVFQWYLDNETLGNQTGRNATVKASGTGTHVLKLRVVDDDGDFTEVELEFKVVESSSLSDLLDRIFSTFVLIVLVGFLLAILMGVYQISKRTKELPPPEKPEPEEEKEEDDRVEDEDEVEEEGEDAGETEDPVEGPEKNISEPDDDDLEYDGPPLPLPEELSKPAEVPPPPAIDDLEVPDVDDSIFDI
ncbi:MAG: PKD domain-containing protein [Thermoplasmatota archaeon]